MGRPGGRRGPRGQRALRRACGSGACTSRTAGRSATRTTTTSWTGSAALRDQGAKELAADPDAQIAFCGDYNIAPTDDDIWSVEFYRHQTHVTPPERAAFGELVAAGFADVVRPFTPGPGVYTYWDYKQLSFPKRRGMRIDFALASPALAARVTGAFIDREERKGKGASDHAPVIVELELTDGRPRESWCCNTTRPTRRCCWATGCAAAGAELTVLPAVRRRRRPGAI